MYAELAATRSRGRKARLMDLHEAKQRWARELDLAETFLPDEPIAALDLIRETTREIEARLEATPDARDELSLLLARARTALARSEQVSERWLASSAERGRRRQAREIELAGLPLRAMRSPWPPPAGE
jgi:hypothetical protein